MVVEQVVTVRANTYRVIPGTDGALVSSATHQGGWHLVRDGQCDCPSSLYRRRCAHIDAVAVALGPAQPTQRALCRECGQEPAAPGRRACVNCLLYGR